MISSIDEIEKELNRLYEAKGEACRASLFNLVVWASVLPPLTENFPCRLILITKTDRPKLEIEVSIKGMCDLIEIHTPESELKKLPFLILPLLLPDLAIYLLWGDTEKNGLYEMLAPHATRILTDSNITWSLITGWRRVIARALDNHDASNASSIEIRYNEGTNDQARFLKAWLISKLALSPAIFTLTPSSGEGLPGDILSLDIRTPTYEVSLVRKKSQVLYHFSTHEACELPQTFPLTHITRGFNFWRELLFEPLSPDYLPTLRYL